jgi:hypothetical protein
VISGRPGDLGKHFLNVYKKREYKHFPNIKLVSNLSLLKKVGRCKRVNFPKLIKGISKS